MHKNGGTTIITATQVAVGYRNDNASESSAPKGRWNRARKQRKNW